MNNSVVKVGEIFREAGAAYNRLSELTFSLHLMEDAQPGGKWTDEEIKLLYSCIHRFAVDLNKLGHRVKNRTATRKRTTLNKKAFEETGNPVRQVSSSVPTHSQSPAQPQQVATSLSLLRHPTMLGNNAEVTLNMLNAPESEVDVHKEGLGGEVKLEFDTSNDDVPM